MQLLDGKLVSGIIKDTIKNEIDQYTSKGYPKPHLCAVLVGADPASETYVSSKIKSCEQLGINSTLCKYDSTVSEEELLDKIIELNSNKDIDGILVQLPLPAHISVDKIIEHIDPEKDVDGFHPVNIGKMVKNIPTFLPATPKGILEIIEYYKLETKGKNCVVIGRSQIVGTPISLLMGRKDYPGNCTVTLVHSLTKNMAFYTREADILIAAIGIPHFIKADMVKEGAVVIDVGINRITDETKKSGHRLIGDVDFENVAQKCSYITPVPGGIGAMTIASLMQNTLQSAIKRKYSL